MSVRIVEQELMYTGVLVTYSDGTVSFEPYEEGETGERFVNMDPNQEIFRHGALYEKYGNTQK